MELLAPTRPRRTARVEGPWEVPAHILLDPADGLDFGALIVPPNIGATVAVAGADRTEFQTVRLSWPSGRELAMTAYAVPGSGGYEAVAVQSSIDQARAAGARSVGTREGPLGPEVIAADGDVVHVLFAIERPRWMLRATLGTTQNSMTVDVLLTRALLSRVGVRRGRSAIPPGAALSVMIPPEWTANPDLSPNEEY